MPATEADSEVPVRAPTQGFLTSPDDTTVGGGGEPYSGIGWSSLPPYLRAKGRSARERNFPKSPPSET
ncbi:MAG: hypothetical protein RLZZ70_612 [Candidatus Parcubacteria bacterium]|jgi:hypothetical protein